MEGTVQKMYHLSQKRVADGGGVYTPKVDYLGTLVRVGKISIKR